MINFNGNIVASDTDLTQNRAFLYGDGVFETLKIIDSKVLFMEDHYFRLMASMRILRMEIPMAFTMEYIEEQIISAAKANGIEASARVRMTVFRNDGGYYLPTDQTISFLIHCQALKDAVYSIGKAAYEVDLYKDFYVTRQLLSSVKSTNRIINITGSIFASENGLDNCLLLNDAKNVIEGLNGNIFLLSANKLITPPVSEGCVNGILRKQVLAIARKLPDLEVVEAPISPFDLQKADELFLTNIIIGIQPVTRYRKKEFPTDFAASLLMKLNTLIRLG